MSPSNPTGAVYPREEIEAIGRWAASHGIWVVTDEIYEHLVYGGAEHHSMPVVVPELADTCMVVNGVAKTYAMTGWRVGWMLGPADVIAAATNLQSHETSNVANVSQRAALAAVSGDLAAVAMMREAFDRRRLTIHRLLNEIDGIECLLPEGAFYAFPSVSGLYGRPIRGRTCRPVPSWPRWPSTRPRWPWCPARRSARPGTSGCPTHWATTTWSRASDDWRSCSQAEPPPTGPRLAGGRTVMLYPSPAAPGRPCGRDGRRLRRRTRSATERNTMGRVLVTEKLAQPGLDLMSAAGHEVDVKLGLSPEELVEAIVGANALVIRSATTVTAEVLAAGTDLVVVGRAGIGLDNVDVAAATERGVMVVNAPQSNILSAAEQAMALLLAQARNIPQAHAALVAGKWERSKWEGVELHGKTLGVVGLGRVGALVAQRALAFGMRLVAYDPFVSADRARHMGVELMDLDQLMAESDFVTVHLPKNKETLGLIGADMLAKAKPGLRIINTARGGIVDEDALADAIRNGPVQGAGLDVFAKEPRRSRRCSSCRR